MGRNTGSHSHRDAFCPVDQQIRYLCRQHLGLLLRLVKVRNEIHHILVQIRQIGLLGNLLQTGLRISHGRRPVSLDGAKVSVAFHQRQPLLEILGHDHQSLVDGTVPVGMIFTHGVAHDPGGFSEGPVVADPQLVHIVKGSPLYRFQSVPHVRQCPGDNHAHGVIDIGFLHDLRIFRLNQLFLLCHFPLLLLSRNRIRPIRFCQISSSASLAWR